MLAAMEKPMAAKRTAVTPACGLLPTVTYDYANQRITATVIVGWDAATKELVVHAPLIAIPKGGKPSPWTLLWKVLPDPTTVSKASFRSATEGVEIPEDYNGPNLPPKVTISRLEPVPSPDAQPPKHWTATIANTVRSSNSFHYILSVKGTPLGTTQAMFKRHDPTIVVTPDPMGG